MAHGRLHRRKAPRSGIRDEDKIPAAVELKHYQWVRGLRCCIDGLTGHVCEGRIEVMHVRQGMAGGMGKKPPADRVIPGCSAAHRYQHVIGEKQFEREFGISMVRLAERVAWESPPLKVWRASRR